MQQFLKWTLEEIRKDGSMMSWMEEKRFEWVPLAASMLKNLLNGHTFIVITDDDRTWFGQYMLKSINNQNKNRPFVPFVSLQTLYPNLQQMKNKDDIELMENLLGQVFPSGYTFFYIGKNSDIRMQFALSDDDSLDIKLIQLFKLLDKSIDAVLFAEVIFENE